jgi:hypothetical protein
MPPLALTPLRSRDLAKAFNPNQARDPHGRWSGGGGAGQGGRRSSAPRSSWARASRRLVVSARALSSAVDRITAIHAQFGGRVGVSAKERAALASHLAGVRRDLSRLYGALEALPRDLRALGADTKAALRRARAALRTLPRSCAMTERAT